MGFKLRLLILVIEVLHDLLFDATGLIELFCETALFIGLVVTRYRLLQAGRVHHMVDTLLHLVQVLIKD